MTDKINGKANCIKATHIPVMLPEVLAYLKPSSGAQGQARPACLMVDATCGEGGHAEAFLTEYPGLLLLCVDADREQVSFARKRLEKFGSRVKFFNMRFTEFFSGYDGFSGEKPDRIFFDLGVSRFHFEKSGRGFSFQRDEYLDMRIDETREQTAFDIINKSSEQEISRILREYGEETWAKNIARSICQERKVKPIRTSEQLAAIVLKAIPPKFRKRRIHPATKTFQALRIAVNQELLELEQGLAQGFRILKKGGRIAVISFHSLEDRIVKQFFRSKNKSCNCPDEWPICQCKGEKELVLLTKKPLMPQSLEVRANPASRSARLRVVEKCA